jgi:hypothetical protein
MNQCYVFDINGLGGAERGYGTLYTAIYRPARGEVEYRWPEASWTFSFAAFGEGVKRIISCRRPRERWLQWR